MQPPYGTCRKCGWSGHDWQFRWGRYCHSCNTEWRQERARLRRELKPPKEPNDVSEITDGISVTRNVKNRLTKEARKDIPFKQSGETIEWIGYILLIVSGFASIATQYHWLALGIPIAIALIVIGQKTYNKELDNYKPILDARLEELARERQTKIDETQAFYASAEWRLIRKQVIKEHGRYCNECGCYIKRNIDLTVDHINPRSKFPEQALRVGWVSWTPKSGKI